MIRGEKLVCGMWGVNLRNVIEGGMCFTTKTTSLFGRL
jgi:Leu/Phe-tRNA-protein transferase